MLSENFKVVITSFYESTLHNQVKRDRQIIN